jgi:ribonuclease HI
MRFRGEPVWVRVDEAGQPVLDRDGRAEMKYRPDDHRSYRPASVNLTPLPPEEDPAPPARAAAAGDVIEVWTDGACSGNPGPMGIGVVVVADGKRREHGEYLGTGTNNIAELTAIQRGLEIADELVPGGTRPIHLHSDSSYSIGVLSKGWKAKANQDLVARLRRMLSGRPGVTLVKVAGHAGVPENERCDELARDAITRRSAR